ncbi:MAG: hypothetical protein QM696_03740 [Steroidobacteraceae bacterium]
MGSRAHSGQAMVVMLAFAASLAATFAIVFSAGQTVNDKMKLLNASDAAVLAAAQWQARSLNYQAYLNRAIVANEVAIAQLVSLRSWSAYVATTTRNAARVTTVVPPLAAAMRAVERGWAVVDRGIQSGAPPLEGGLSGWNVEVLTRMQALAHVQAPIVAADLAAQVVRDNEPRALLAAASRALQARNGNTWLNRFTQAYRRGGGDLARFSALLASSRDGFSAQRSGDLLPSGSPLQVSRRGGTDLIGEYSWRGVDTLSTHLNLLITDAETPLGWGAAENRLRPVAGRGTHGGSLRRNPRASRLATRALAPRQGYRGLPEIRDVSQPQRRDVRTLVYSLALRIPGNEVPTADRLLMPQGLALPDGSTLSVAPALAAQSLHALASALVRFERPEPRHDGREEYASLFSPYWQARLTATPLTDQALTLADRGLAVDPFVATR